MTISNLFEQAIKELGLKTHAQLAEELGVEPLYIYRLRSGYRPVTPGVVLVLADVPGWPPRWIKEHLGLPCAVQVLR